MIERMEKNMEEQIMFRDEEGTEQGFFVVEETRINGVNYLLVASSQDDDAECMILKDTSDAEEAEAIYEIVEDEELLNSLVRVFSELLEDVEIQ